MKSGYDFYQKVDARRIAIVRLVFLAVFSGAFWFFLAKHIIDLPIFPRCMMIGIWAIGVLMFANSCVPYLRSGGIWLIYIRDRIIHIDFPECEANRCFEIQIDDIVEINETRVRTHAGDRTSNSRPTIMLVTGPSTGHLLPEPQEIRIESLLKTLKRLCPELRHRINGKNK